MEMLILFFIVKLDNNLLQSHMLAGRPLSHKNKYSDNLDGYDSFMLTEKIS